eukprot:gene27184-biopygen3623
MVAVEEDFERSKQATVMSHHFSGTALVATPTKAATRPSQTHATQRFHEVRQVKRQEEEFDDHDDEPESSVDEIDDQEEEESFLQELDTLGNDRNNRFTQRSNFSQNNPDRTRAPFTIMRKDKPKTGCFRMLFHGSCEKGDKCSYAHDPNTLSKMHDYYANLLRTSKFKPTRTDVSRNDPVAVLEEAEPDQALLAQEEVAPEDLDTPLPSSFPDALHFMEMSHEEAVKEFHSQFEKHVHKDFAEATPILALLKEKGTHVFVPQNWEGIKGVPDIDLELKEDYEDAYRKSFSFMLRHIPGKENTVADWLSRVHERDTPNTHPVELANAEPTTPEELLRRVHGGRMGHYGARRTWKLLGTFFPGHHIPYHVVEEFVATCPICQKSRLGMTDSIQPVVRHLKPEGRRSMVGVDTLTITPPDKNGFKYLVVIVNHFTKFAVLVPTKTKDALTVAHALFTYFATFGLVDCIISDPGSEYENQLLEHLHSWLGIRHRFSLVERHESNGVEGTNKQILRHLRALVLDERVVSHWVSLIPFIQFMLNSTDNSETGVIPYHAHFGTADETYCRLPLPDGTHEGREGDGTVSIDPADFDIKNMAKLTQAYLSALDKNLAVLYKISKEYQAKIALERTKDTPSDKQNTYQKGDFVLWQRNPDDPLPTKLTTPFVGPFEVLEQYKNDVECRHVLHGNIQKFHVSRLKLFH